MKRILVTGFSGFVGRHFLHEIAEACPDAALLGLDVRPPAYDLSEETPLSAAFTACDMLDAAALEEAVRAFSPDAVLHLAAFSSVAYSWEHPAECFGNNTRIFLNLAEAVRGLPHPCRILSVGSSEVYGNVSEDELPITEDCALRPQNPYAVARVSQEMLAKLFTDSFGMDIVLTRSFNHIGPGQDNRFVISGFLDRMMQIARRGETSGTIRTGDLTVIRDFTDVRDVVRAYRMLLEKGTPGEVYNICSGRGTKLSEAADRIAETLGISVAYETDPALVRPKENRAVTGSYERIHRLCGWEPQITLSQTIADMAAYGQNK